MEKMRDKLPLLYEQDDMLLTMIQQRDDAERVSTRNLRLPLQIRPRCKAGLANMDGGPGTWFGHDLRRGAGDSDFLPACGGNQEAGGTRDECAGQGRGECGRGGSEKRNGVIPIFPGQSAADGRQRSAADHWVAVIEHGREAEHIHDDQTARRAICLSQPDDRGVRPDSDDERWIVQCATGGSIQQPDRN